MFSYLYFLANEDFDLTMEWSLAKSRTQRDEPSLTEDDQWLKAPNLVQLQLETVIKNKKVLIY